MRYQTWTFDRLDIAFQLEEYAGGGTAVQAYSHEDGAFFPYAKISVFIENAPQLPEGQFYLKHWSENRPIVLALVDEGLIEVVKPQITVSSGYIVTQAWQFTEKGKHLIR